MDPSALIFVALAVAWVAYLLPKALEHHEAGARSRTVDRFSHTMRVLARREPVDRRSTRLVKAGQAVATANPVTPAEPVEPVEAVRAGEPESAPRPGISITDTGSWALAGQRPVRRGAAASAARRRRRVLSVILVVTAMVASCAVGKVIHWAWIAAPLTVLVAWLVACRVMVKGEQAARRAARVTRAMRPPTPAAVVEADDRVDDPDATSEVPVVRAELAEAAAEQTEAGWAPVPVTLPTYVSKPAARRSVSTIDLDSTGVWTSGRTAADSALAREADAARAAQQPQAPSAERRATGS